MSQGESGSNDKDALARSVARRYLELWQDQISAVFADPQHMAQAGRMLSKGMTPPTAEQLWTLWREFANLQAAAGGFGQERHDQQRPGNSAGTAPPGKAPPGAEAASASSAGSDQRMDEFLARFQALEERLAALESGTGTKGKRAGARKRGNSKRGPAKRP